MVISAKTNPLFRKREGRRGGGPRAFSASSSFFSTKSWLLGFSNIFLSLDLYSLLSDLISFIEAGTWKSSIGSNLSNILYFSHSTLLCTCLMSGSHTILENPKGQLGALDHLSQHLLCPFIPFSLRQQSPAIDDFFKLH